MACIGEALHAGTWFVGKAIGGVFNGFWTGLASGGRTAPEQALAKQETLNQPKAEGNNTPAPNMTQTQTNNIYTSPPSSAEDTAGATSSGMEKAAAATINYITTNPPLTPSWRDDVRVGCQVVGIVSGTIGSVVGIAYLKERWDGSNDATLLKNLYFPHCGNLHVLPEKALGRLWGRHDCIEKRGDETMNAIHRLRKNNSPDATTLGEDWKRCFVREEWRTKNQIKA